MEVPIWGAWLLGVVAMLTAIGYLFQKIVKPTFRFVRAVDEALPPLKLLADVFAGEPNLVKVIHDIARQFKTDSGSSLRDVVNRLDQAAEDNRRAADVLAVGVESTKQMAEVDRKQVQRLVILLDRLTIQVDSNQHSLKEGQARIESTQTKVKDVVEEVSSDLTTSHERADEASSDIPGEASDAASHSPVDDE